MQRLLGKVGHKDRGGTLGDLSCRFRRHAPGLSGHMVVTTYMTLGVLCAVRKNIPRFIAD